MFCIKCSGGTDQDQSERVILHPIWRLSSTVRVKNQGKFTIFMQAAMCMPFVPYSMIQKKIIWSHQAVTDWMKLTRDNNHDIIIDSTVSQYIMKLTLLTNEHFLTSVRQNV